MIVLHKPSEAAKEKFLLEQQTLRYSYPHVAASMHLSQHVPAGYTRDRYRLLLGQGEGCFVRAKSALIQWTMYNNGWTELYPTIPEVRSGETVNVIANHFGFWSFNAVRIVYRVDEQGYVRRFGFAVGTLPGHLEQGEERFCIEWHQEDDSVWYELFAFSKPKHQLVKLGYPLARMMQKRFAIDSQQAMRQAVTEKQTLLSGF